MEWLDEQFLPMVRTVGGFRDGRVQERSVRTLRPNGARLIRRMKRPDASEALLVD